MNTSQDIYRILLVDDSQAVREGLSWLLQDESSMKVAGEADNGMEAIRLAATLKPDLVILDIELPDIDGFSVTQKMKALLNPPLIILLSIHSDEISKQRGESAGCDAYVEKGISWPKLLEVLHKVLKITE